MNKKIYFDLETTGLDPIINGIIQIAGIIEVDGKEVEEFNMKLKPFELDVIEEEALKVSGTTREEIRTFEDPNLVYAKITSIFNKYIDKYNRDDKFIVCGYNVRFDINFLKEFFVKNGDNYLFSYFGQPKDPFPVIQYLSAIGKIISTNNKLSTICEYFKIDIKDAHDAMVDIKATKTLIEKIDKSLLKINIWCVI